MFPVLRPGDRLVVLPYGEGRIRAGDVVVFRPPCSHEVQVHRVVQVGKAGVRTRGDANRHLDPWLLQPHELLGKVMAVRRGRRTLTIAGGAQGRLMGLCIHAAYRLARQVLTPDRRGLLEKSLGME